MILCVIMKKNDNEYMEKHMKEENMFLKLNAFKNLVKNKKLPDRLLIATSNYYLTLEKNNETFKLSIKKEEQEYEHVKEIDSYSEFEMLQFAEHGDWYHLMKCIEKIDGEISFILRQDLPYDDFSKSLQWMVTNFLVERNLLDFKEKNPNSPISYFDFDNIVFRQKKYKIKEANSEIKRSFIEQCVKKTFTDQYVKNV